MSHLFLLDYHRICIFWNSFYPPSFLAYVPCWFWFSPSIVEIWNCKYSLAPALWFQGCSLRNTEYIIGAVIFAGHETKVCHHDVHYNKRRPFSLFTPFLSSWCALQQTMTIFLVYPLFIFRCAKTLNSFVTGFPAFRVVIPLLNAVSTKKICSKLAFQFNLESWLLKLFLFINWLTALGFQKFYLCVPTKKSCIVLWFSDTLSPSYH